MRLLKKSYLTSLDQLANGLEENCIDKQEIFHNMEVQSFGEKAIPYIIQELRSEGSIEQCRNNNEVRITSRGRGMLNRSVESNSRLILDVLCERTGDQAGRVTLGGREIEELTDLTPAEINDAVYVLAEKNYIQSTRALGTNPYMFFMVTLTPKGRYEYQRLSNLEKPVDVKQQAPVEKELYVGTPAGSPYGFTELDWEQVTIRKHDTSSLFVVFGYQWKSAYYKTDRLKKNIEVMFQKAMEEYKKMPRPLNIKLNFRHLAAGYGEHQFNRIACDIISADIAIFDTSDLNPNVMIELGVALTWDVRVLPIRNMKSPKIPSDISGQTWAEYTVNGLKFTDKNHLEKLVVMIDRAAQRKQRP